MSVEDSASDANGASADSAKGQVLRLTLQQDRRISRLGDLPGASVDSVTCLVLQQTRRPGGASADLMSVNEPLVPGESPC